MTIPEWFISMIPHLTLAEIRILAAIIEHGRPIADREGSHVVAASISFSKLARLTSLSRPSVAAGIEGLNLLGLLQRYRPTRPNAAAGYSVPIIAIGGGKKSLPPQIEGSKKTLPPNAPDQIRGGKKSLPLMYDDDIHTGIYTCIDHSSSLPLEVVKKLDHLGFTDSESFIARHDHERVLRAIEYVESLSGVRAPGAMVRHLVKSAQAVPEPASVKREDPDKYIKGKYGHLVVRDASQCEVA